MAVVRADAGSLTAVFKNPVYLIFAALGTIATVFLVTDSVKFYAAIPVGVIGLLVIISRPRLGFYLTIMSIPLEMAGKIGNILPFVNLTLAKIFALATLLAWTVHVLARKTQIVWPKEVIVLCLYFIAGLISLIDAEEQTRGYQELIILASTIIFLFLVCNLIRSREHMTRTLALFAVVSLATFAYAVVQRVLPNTEIKERIGWLEEGEASNGLEVSGIESKSIGVVRRATGTTAHSNVLAADTAFLVPILFGFMNLSRNRWIKILLWTGVGICFAAAIASLSRTGMLTYLLILPMLLATKLLRINIVGILLGFIGFLASIPFLPEGISRIFNPELYLSKNSVSVSERYKLWDAAIRALADHPFNGMGIGNNRGIFAYYENSWNPGLLTVHNSYLQVGIETGMIGMAAILAFIIFLLYRGLKARRIYAKLGDEWGYVMSTSIMISITAFFIMGALAYDFMRIGFKNMWLMMGCLVLLHRLAGQAFITQSANSAQLDNTKNI
jgi:putative inorganic carbon (HCO3(-)) transporter